MRLLGGRQVVLLLALALGVRLAVNVVSVVPNPGRMFKPDSLEYERYARSLLGTHTHSMDEAVPPAPDSFRPPLYAFLLTVTYGLFGHLPLLVVLMQVLLGVATTYLVYDLGRLIASPRLGLGAAAIFAVAPAPVLYSGFILSETLFTFLVLTVLYLAVLPGPLGELRFRVPFMPYLALLAASGVRSFTRT